jgi:predicted TIM-barrel fold metal-dependent hydrolase
LPRIDSHLHVFTKLSAEFPREVKELTPAEAEAPVELLLEQMSTHGVDQAVLVQIGGTEYEQHAYLRHCLRTYPPQFRGIGRMAPDLPADHMDRLAEDGGIIGFRLCDLGGPFDPLQPVDLRACPSFPIWERAAEKDYVLWLFPRAGDSHIIPFLIDAFPQVRVVFNHMMIYPGAGTTSVDEHGRPRIDVSLPPQSRYSSLQLNRYPNVRIHLSGHYAVSREAWPWRDTAEWQTTLLNRFGADRLLWASDFPWILRQPGYDRMVGLLDELLPDLADHERTAVMGDNAAEFLRFPEVPN